MEITAEDREKIRRRQVANILAKLNKGQTITAREQGLLDGDDERVFAKTWDDLAAILGRSRRCLTKWRQKYKGATPKPRADGRHDVEDWRRFMDNNGLGKEPEPQDDGLPPKAHWDRERARVDYERAVFSLEIDRQKYISIDEITAAVGQMLAGFRVALNTLPAGAARWLMGLKDFHQIKDKLQSEVDAVLRALGRCHYLEEITPAVVDKLFPDRDENARAELAQACDAIFQELGRLALSDLLQRELYPRRPRMIKSSTVSGKCGDWN